MNSCLKSTKNEEDPISCQKKRMSSIALSVNIDKNPDGMDLADTGNNGSDDSNILNVSNEKEKKLSKVRLTMKE